MKTKILDTDGIITLK